MTARIIDGKAVAADVRARVAAEVKELETPPGLATVLVGDDPASAIYVRRKHEASEEVGVRSVGHELPATATQAELLALVDELAADEAISGILVQLPLPEGLDADEVIDHIPAGKDVDGLTPVSAGLLARGTPKLVSCTPAGVIELLRHSGTEMEGAEAVIVGRSNLVGRPLISLLIGENATVTVCHRRTRDLGNVCRRADILIAAAGSPRLIKGEMIKPGATVIDVGTNRLDEGRGSAGEAEQPRVKLVGDVDFEQAKEVAGAITPVPGGVGPMTIAMLLSNTVAAAKAAPVTPERAAKE